MPHDLKAVSAISAALALLWSTAGAQETPVPVDAAPLSAPVSVESEGGTPAINEDEMADYLNSQQQIKQDVTLTRTVDGEVVETRKETIIYSKDDPLRSTEAAQSALESLKSQFDKASLTRKEAYDEARLDFVNADQDRDDQMTADEFVYLVEDWRKSDAAVEATDEPITRERFIEFLENEDPAAAGAESAAQARSKFEFMAGLAGMLNRRNYIREVLADFEAHDLDRDGLLRGNELLNFRAANRGEPLGSQ